VHTFFFLFFLSWCLIAVLTVHPLILSDEIKSACAASLARMIEFAIQYHSSDVLWIQAINAEATLVAPLPHFQVNNHFNPLPFSTYLIQRTNTNYKIQTQNRRNECSNHRCLRNLSPGFFPRHYSHALIGIHFPPLPIYIHQSISYREYLRNK
jgi:hypothetical protein